MPWFLLFLPRLILAVVNWMSTILPHMVGLSANLDCRSEMCCTLLAGNTGCKNDAKNHRLRNITQLCWAISSQLRHLSTIRKKLVKQQYLLQMSHSMVNFGPLAADIGPVVWGTPANSNRFRVFAALLHGTPVMGASQTLQR